MNYHQNLILDAADLNEAVTAPLTAEGMTDMLAMVDAMAARLALVVGAGQTPGGVSR